MYLPPHCNMVNIPLCLLSLGYRTGTCIHTHVTHICTYTRAHTYQVYMLTWICIQHTDVGITHLYALVPIRMCSTYIHMHIRTYIYTHTSVYIHTSICTHIHEYLTWTELFESKTSWISPLKTSGASLKNKDILLHTFKVFIIPKKINSKALMSYYI